MWMGGWGVSECLCLCCGDDGLLLSCFNFVVVLKGCCFGWLVLFFFFFSFFLMKCNILTRTLLTFEISVSFKFVFDLVLHVHTVSASP